MQASSRREKIVETLRSSSGPVSAGTLAGLFGVSRQIIVGDIALLRASGADITATPRGYILAESSGGVVHKIPCRHRPEEMERELQIMVDNGCHIRDVIVEHPVYGQLVGQLNLSTRYDVDEFIVKVQKSDAAALSGLTGGIHLHTVYFPDEKCYERVLSLLRENGFLYEDQG